MQKFYDQLVEKSEIPESDQTWQNQLSHKTLKEITLLKTSALDWDSWSEDGA